MSNRRVQILISTDYFLPGYKAGGPIRSLAGICAKFGDEYAFKIVTRDRDLGSKEPYQAIRVNEWQRVDNVEVYYVSPGRINPYHLGRLINATEHDVLYLQSFFSPWFSIFPLLLRRMRLTRKVPVIVAPRGEFSAGALRIKRAKKKVYLAVAFKSGLYKQAVLQASSIHEEKDIMAINHYERVLIASTPVIVAKDVALPSEGFSRVSLKKPGCLRVIFLSRIAKMKNLDGALKMLRGLRGEVALNIFGPIEDNGYWDTCQTIIKTLPRNVVVHYRGVLNHDNVGKLFCEHDLFLLPSHGENFGHVILEALSAGCPILISDNTPWRNLSEAGVGWDLPLSRPERFTEILQDCVAMDSERWLTLSEKASAFSRKCFFSSEVIDENRHLFQEALRLMQ